MLLQEYTGFDWAVCSAQGVVLGCSFAVGREAGRSSAAVRKRAIWAVARGLTRVADGCPLACPVVDAMRQRMSAEGLPVFLFCRLLVSTRQELLELAGPKCRSLPLPWMA